MNRCPTCGTTYSDDARFCTRDGAQLLAAGSNGRFTDPAMAGLIGQTLEGKYHVLEKIGEGGMSSVFLATDGTPGGRCAIKVLCSALSRDANAIARLRREASFGMRLEHPNLCHIIHVGQTDDGLIFVVMPVVEGELLADRVRRLGHIPLDQAVLLVADIAAGLGAAHALDIVHRDLKPENVMVRTRPDGNSEAVVMDFGLAKERALSADLKKLTATGIVLGTPEFMSPEQIRGKPLDARSDIYALALVAYEMLTGRLPFAGHTQQELMIARLSSDPVPLRAMCPELDFPASLEQVLITGLARDPNTRYSSAAAFADAFVHAAGGAPNAFSSDQRLRKIIGH